METKINTGKSDLIFGEKKKKSKVVVMKEVEHWQKFSRQAVE